MNKLMKFATLALMVCLATALPADLERRDLIKASKPTMAASNNELAVEQTFNTSEWNGVNPCEATRNFNYYVAFPNDTSRYILCNPWGTGELRQCSAPNSAWNMWTLRCERPDSIRNLTLALPLLPHAVFNCSLSGHECHNGGVCTESSLGGDRCICKPEFTGPACESHLNATDLIHEIMGGNFSIGAFRQHLAEFNISTSADQYAAAYRDHLDNVTFGALAAYMSLYNGTEIRYDTLLNNLVEAVLGSIYPDAAYLSSFNASLVSVVDLVQLIPNLMSYSKYSIERYEDVFAKYQQVLDRLVVAYLNGSSSLRAQAAAYSRLTVVFLNQTVLLANKTTDALAEKPAGLDESLSIEPHIDASQSQLTESQVRDSLRAQFNATLVTTQRLFDSLEAFQRGVAKLVAAGSQDVFALTLDQAKLNGTAEIGQMLEQISASSVQIWESLVNYGFWYVTSLLTTPVSVLAQSASSAIKQIV